ncbi:MAG: hypothetical protein N2V77_02925 [Canidatus Methanoxibalbensis ujae]|nr:hypothetical protein [Candidatus Methanoxibalbensis ujae]
MHLPPQLLFENDDKGKEIIKSEWEMSGKEAEKGRRWMNGFLEVSLAFKHLCGICSSSASSLSSLISISENWSA